MGTRHVNTSAKPYSERRNRMKKAIKNIRDKLLREMKLNNETQYSDGVLDMYNETMKILNKEE